MIEQMDCFQTIENKLFIKLACEGESITNSIFLFKSVLQQQDISTKSRLIFCFTVQFANFQPRCCQQFIQINKLYQKQYIIVLEMRKNRELQVIQSINAYPTEYSNRNCTDVFCIILGVLYSLSLIITAAFLFNRGNLYKVNFPSDSDGVLCGIDKPAYPFVYFVDPLNSLKRVCITNCPMRGDEKLKCLPTNYIGCRFENSLGFQVKYYQSEPQQTRSGYFCLPEQESLRKIILSQSKLQSRDLFFKSLDTVILSFFVALGLSALYFVITQLFPTFMTYFVIILGSITILGSVACIFTYGGTQNIFRIIAGVLLSLVIVITVISFFNNRGSLHLHSIFLRYSTKFLKEKPMTLLYIPLFFIFLFAFIVIIVLQFTSFWTSGSISFRPDQSVYYKLAGSGPVILTFFLGIQTIWGFTFIKLAFNFCVSGAAVLWYYSEDEKFGYPLKLLITKHFGSVIGGSFIVAFFTAFDFTLDLLKPQPSEKESFHYKCYEYLCGSHGLFDLVRADSMAYINLTGNPFCNSARYCQLLCLHSVIMDKSQSTGRVYSLCAHLFLVGTIAIFALYIKGAISIYALGLICLNTIFVSTFLISIHSDVSEAISIIFLTQEQMGRKKNKILNYGLRVKSDIEAILGQVKIQKDIADEVKKIRLQQVQRDNQQLLVQDK